MRNWMRHASLGLGLFLATALPAPALEVGDRAPRLNLSTAEGTAFTLPNAELSSPIIVWFPLAWRTPTALCQKLITVAQNNHASVVIVPIFSDAEAARRMPQFAKTPTEKVAETPANQDPSKANAENSPDAISATPAEANDIAVAEEYNDEVSESNSAEALEASKVEGTDRNDTESLEAGNDEGSADDDSEVAAERKRAEAVQAYRQRLTELSALYPDAHFLGDEDNQALIHYTEAYATNLMPNPNLFILDAHGEVTWTAFYPGLTAGTLTRAIVSARPQRNRHN